MTFSSKGVVHWVGKCCTSESHRICVRCFEQLPALPAGEVTKYTSADGVEYFMLGHAANATECQPTLAHDPNCQHPRCQLPF